MKYTISNGYIIDKETGEVLEQIYYEIVDLQIDYWNNQKS